MVLGIFKHIYRYYVPENKSPPPPPLVVVPCKPSASIKPAPDLIPVYSDDRKTVLYYIERPETKSEAAPQRSEVIPSSHISSASAHGIISRPASAKPLPPLPTQTPAQAHVGVLNWTGWPDEPGFSHTFTHEEYMETGKLRVHWSTRTRGRGGYEAAEVASEGKCMDRSCNGIIVCVGYPTRCSRIVRPHSKALSIAKQLNAVCEVCQDDLLHLPCPNISTIYHFAGGVHFKNGLAHNHPRVPHVLHPLPAERQRFEELVVNNPKAKPNKLCAGLPTVYGTGQPVSNISPAFANCDRVGQERRKIMCTANAAAESDKYHLAFADFVKSHPDFVHQTIHGIPTVISFQTPFMRENLVKDDFIEDEPLNSVLSDTTHGFFGGKSSYLMTSCSFNEIIQRWVPGLWSYVNGATTQHFHYHFLALFKGIAEEVSKRGLELKDRHFAVLIDFSLAERNGAQSAYISFWKERGDSRSDEELQRAAQNLLKGCREHYFASITRVARLGAIIPPEKKDNFKTRAIDLIDLPSPKEFLSELASLIQEFPLAKPWFDWWAREDNARILIKLMQDMDPVIWDGLPGTNNAQEAMHWSLYSTYGRDHDFFTGADRLFAVAKDFDCKIQNELIGCPTAYGKKSIVKKRRMERKTRTKPHLPSRDPRVRSTLSSGAKSRFINDGRPNDTSKGLLAAAKKERKVKKTKESNDDNANFDVQGDASLALPAPNSSPSLPKSPSVHTQKLYPSEVLLALKESIKPKIHANQGYIWKGNSCWLDTSLELFYRAMIHDFQDFANAAIASPKDHLLLFCKAFESRQKKEMAGNLTVDDLALQRDELRQHLLDLKCLSGKTINDFDNVFAWLPPLLKTREFDVPSYRLEAYFEELVLHAGRCDGKGLDDRHFFLPQTPLRRFHRSVTDIDVFKKYQGKIERWFSSQFEIEWGTAAECWRNPSNKPFGVPDCPSKCHNSNSFTVSLPVLYIIEAKIKKPGTTQQPERWHFPATLTPPGGTASNGQIYKLIGAVFSSSNHFLCRYASKDFRSVFHYNGMDDDGIAHRIPGGYKKLLTGVIPSPPGFTLWAVLYRLKGGSTAQADFCTSWWSMLEERHSIRIRSSSVISSHPLSVIPSSQYSHSKFRPLLSKEQPWIKSFTKTTRQRTEYQYMTSPTEEDDNLHPESEDLVESPASPSIPECSPAPSELNSVPAMEIDKELNCRCGVKNPLSQVEPTLDGDVIKCGLCGEWSHIACQRNCRASDLKKKEVFTCDGCNLYELERSLPARHSARQTCLQLAKPKTRLDQRLRPGLGVLARWGDFWYPARLILKQDNDSSWLVEWWRGNCYD